jgi:hypothetical protein
LLQLRQGEGWIPGAGDFPDRIAIVSGSDVRTITTMVFGVAFLSIAIQTPSLSRFIKRRFGNQQLL